MQNQIKYKAYFWRNFLTNTFIFHYVFLLKPIYMLNLVVLGIRAANPCQSRSPIQKSKHCNISSRQQPDRMRRYLPIRSEGQQLVWKHSFHFIFGHPDRCSSAFQIRWATSCILSKIYFIEKKFHSTKGKNNNLFMYQD